MVFNNPHTEQDCDLQYDLARYYAHEDECQSSLTSLPTNSPTTVPTIPPATPPTYSPITPPTNSSPTPPTYSPITSPTYSSPTAPTYSPITSPTNSDATPPPTIILGGILDTSDSEHDDVVVLSPKHVFSPTHVHFAITSTEVVLEHTDYFSARDDAASSSTGYPPLAI